MATQPTPNRLTFDEYLHLEEQAAFKSEYRGGEMFAMAGCTDVHARLAAELIYLLRGHSDGCRVHTSDLKVYVPSVDESMCPDVIAICGLPDYYNDRRDVVLNPTVVIEVLSSSTAQYDKGLKSELYRRIPSLRAIVLVDSEKPYFQVQSRFEDGNAWIIRETSEPLDTVRFDRWAFSLGTIYGDILAG